jgi:hypothetical protein
MRPALASHLLCATVALAGLQTACDGGDEPSGNPPPAPASEPRCAAPRTVGCVDQSIASLRLLTAPSPAAVTTTVVESGIYESQIDATGGGLPPSLSFVYVRFGEAGLEKVDIGDEAAFESMDWDLAFRRYLIRVNGGASGPSCVDVAAVGDAPLASLARVPLGVEYETDLFLEPPTCTAGENNTDPMGAPLTAISGYFSYEACLAMTGENYIIRLRNGRYVAMQVIAYYSKPVQERCNQDRRLPGGPSGAGSMVIRWKYLAPPPV